MKDVRATRRNMLGFSLLVSRYHTNKFRESYFLVKNEETKLGNRKYGHIFFCLHLLTCSLALHEHEDSDLHILCVCRLYILLFVTL